MDEDNNEMIVTEIVGTPVDREELPSRTFLTVVVPDDWGPAIETFYLVD